MNKGRVNTSKRRGDPIATGTNAQSKATQNEKKPVNLLFSNEDDMDDDSDEA